MSQHRSRDVCVNEGKTVLVRERSLPTLHRTGSTLPHRDSCLEGGRCRQLPASNAQPSRDGEGGTSNYYCQILPEHKELEDIVPYRAILQEEVRARTNILRGRTWRGESPGEGASHTHTHSDTQDFRQHPLQVAMHTGSRLVHTNPPPGSKVSHSAQISLPQVYPKLKDAGAVIPSFELTH